MPDVASEPTNVIVTGWLYQPFESAARSTDAELTVGASVSILNCSESCQVAALVVGRAAVERVVARVEGLRDRTVGVHHGIVDGDVHHDRAPVPAVVARRARRDRVADRRTGTSGRRRRDDGQREDEARARRASCGAAPGGSRGRRDARRSRQSRRRAAAQCRREPHRGHAARARGRPASAPAVAIRGSANVAAG